MLLFSRTEEFERSVATARRLHGSVVVTLSPVTRIAAVECLQQQAQTLGVAAESWKPLLAHLAGHPRSALARSLDSPLMLTLLRDLVNHSADRSEGRELTGADRFGTPRDVEQYLLERFLDTAYAAPYGRRTARRKPYPGAGRAPQWLGRLSAGMDDHSLDWRHLHRWARPGPRVAVTTAVGVLVGVATCAVAFGPPGGAYAFHQHGSVFGLWYRTLLGAFGGFFVGAMTDLRDHEHYRRVPLLASGGPRRRGFNLAVGLLVGILVAWHCRQAVVGADGINGPAMWLYSAVAGVGASVVAAAAVRWRVYPAPERAAGFVA